MAADWPLGGEALSQVDDPTYSSERVLSEPLDNTARDFLALIWARPRLDCYPLGLIRLQSLPDKSNLLTIPAC